MKVPTHKDLIVWQKAMNLTDLVYQATDYFPKSELYGLSSQMRRSAVSIPANIAEGRKRGGKAEYRYFLLIAYSSGAELETLLEISRRRGYLVQLDYQKLAGLLTEIEKMLGKMTRTLKSR